MNPSLLTLLVFSTPLAEPVSAPVDGSLREAIVEILRDTRRPAEQSLEGLRALGVEAIPIVLQLLRQPDEGLWREEGSSFAERGPDPEELLLGALEGWPADDVVPAVAAAFEGELERDERVLALTVLGRAGGPAGAEAAAGLLAGLRPDSMRTRYVRIALTDSVQGVLGRDAAAHRRFADHLGEIDERVLLHVVRAIGEELRGPGLEVLEHARHRSDRIDREIATLLPRLDVRDREEFAGRAASLARSLARQRAVEVRLAAIATLGRLGDEDSFELLVDLLEDLDRRLASTALGALRQLTGLTWPEDVARWRRFATEQGEWSTERGPVLGEEVLSEDVSTAINAIQELSESPMHRRLAVVWIAPGLKRSEPEVARAACLGLGRLRSPAALRHLVGALDHADDSVRSLAWEALRELTELELPPRGADWSDWLAR